MTARSRRSVRRPLPPAWPWALGLAVLVAVAYAGVRHLGFINFDDPQYVADNAAVASGLTWQGAKWAFGSGYAGNWHPITWLSHMLDIELFGMSARAHHLMSAAIHLANTLLLFALLARITGAPARSAVVAALFAVHPLRVESVAWIAERKDVLSTLFWMLTLLAYARYVERPEMRRYLTVTGAFALGLMSKPMLVTLPVTLLLLDVWPLRRQASWRTLVVEKLPLAGLAMVAGIVTLVVQRAAGAMRDFDVIPIGARIANAIVSYAAYLEKMLWPAGLAPLYPYRTDLTWLTIAVSALVLTAISIGVWIARRRAAYLAVGWLWYVITLLPVIGLIQVGSQSMADRYTYVPLIGILVALVWGLADLAGRRVPASVPAAAALVAVALLTAATSRQIEHWRNPVELWTHTIRVTEDNDRAHNNLGQALTLAGRPAEAEQALRESVRLQPKSAEARHNLGVALADQQRDQEAIAEYHAALELSPGHVGALVNLGIALARQGRLDEAVERLEEAERLWPSPDVRRNLATALTDVGLARARQGDWTGALARFEQAIRADPAAANPHNNAGVACERLNRDEEAIAHYREAMRLEPSLADAHLNLGRVFARRAQDEEALRAFLDGLRASPRDADLHYFAGVILARHGRLPEAARHFEAALAIAPGHDAARAELAAVARALGGARP